MIGDGGLATLTDEDDPGADVVPLGRFLYEPDGAVIRAGLVTAVAAGVDGGLLDQHIAYVTADESFRTPFARSLPRSSRTLPYREKQLRAALRERGIGRLTIKKRGVDIVPEQLRKRLALQGDDEATIVLTRVAGQGTCLLVRRSEPTRRAPVGRRRPSRHRSWCRRRGRCARPCRRAGRRASPGSTPRSGRPVGERPAGRARDHRGRACRR